MSPSSFYAGTGMYEKYKTNITGKKKCENGCFCNDEVRKPRKNVWLYNTPWHCITHVRFSFCFQSSRGNQKAEYSWTVVAVGLNSRYYRCHRCRSCSHKNTCGNLMSNQLKFIKSFLVQIVHTVLILLIFLILFCFAFL